MVTLDFILISFTYYLSTQVGSGCFVCGFVLAHIVLLLWGTVETYSSDCVTYYPSIEYKIYTSNCNHMCHPTLASSTQPFILNTTTHILPPEYCSQRHTEHSLFQACESYTILCWALLLGEPFLLSACIWLGAGKMPLSISVDFKLCYPQGLTY